MLFWRFERHVLFFRSSTCRPNCRVMDLFCCKPHFLVNLSGRVSVIIYEAFFFNCKNFGVKQKKAKARNTKVLFVWSLPKDGGGSWRKENVEISSNFPPTTDFSFSSQNFFPSKIADFSALLFYVFVRSTEFRIWAK